MAEGIDEALRADDKGRVLFLLAQHGIRRPAPGSSSKGFCFNEIAKVGGARTSPHPPPQHRGFMWRFQKYAPFPSHYCVKEASLCMCVRVRA